MKDVHRALIENPAYFDMLQQLDEIASEAVSAPVSDQELEKLSTVPVYRTVAEDAVQAINSYEFRPYNLDDLPVSARQLIHSRRLGTFSIDYPRHRILKEEIQEFTRNNGIADNCIGSATEVLLHKEGEFASFMPYFTYAAAYRGARQVIASRLRSDEVQLQVQLALGPEADDGIYHKLARVMDDRLPQESALRYPIEAFVEGYDSVAFAGFHLETGGFRDATTHPDFTKAIGDYTRLMPLSGLLAPMAMRGEYFKGLINPDTREVEQNYRAAFTEYREGKRSRSPEPSTTDVLDEEDFAPASFERPELIDDEQRSYLNQIGFPATVSNRKDLAYEGEGCPAAYYRIIHHAAALFQSTVHQILEKELPEAPYLDLSKIVELTESRNRRR